MYMEVIGLGSKYQQHLQCSYHPCNMLYKGWPYRTIETGRAWSVRPSLDKARSVRVWSVRIGEVKRGQLEHGYLVYGQLEYGQKKHGRLEHGQL